MPKKKIEHFDLHPSYEWDLSTVMRSFLAEIKALWLTPSEVTGNVLVIGPGLCFPERLLLCVPVQMRGAGSLVEFGPLRLGVNSVVTVDTNPYAGPAGYLFRRQTLKRGWPKIKESSFCGQDQPQLLPNTIDHYCAPAVDFLDDLPASVQFNTVLMLRLQHLEDQLPELLSALESHVAPGGLVIGSGHFSVAPTVDDPWSRQRIAHLSGDPLGFSNASSWKHYLGLVCRHDQLR